MGKFADLARRARIAAGVTSRADIAQLVGERDRYLLIAKVNHGLYTNAEAESPAVLLEFAEFLDSQGVILSEEASGDNRSYQDFITEFLADR